MTIGKVQRAKLRDVWPNEAYDFTPWLQENIEELTEVTNLDLSAVEREQSAGCFNVDLVAESDCCFGLQPRRLSSSFNCSLIERACSLSMPAYCVGSVMSCAQDSGGYLY